MGVSPPAVGVGGCRCPSMMRAAVTVETPMPSPTNSTTPLGDEGGVSFFFGYVGKELVNYCRGL